MLFRSITGTIDVTNSRFRTYDVLVRDRSTVNNINKGKISLHGTGCLYMDGDDFNQAGTDTKKASFINEGIIEVVDVVENSDYYYRNLYMEHIKLNNFGTINIVPQTIQIGEGREFIYQTAIAYCYDVEINNYGKLNVNNSKLKGIEINGKYQDTVEGLEGPSSIRNYPSGVITMTSGEGAIALDLGANCALYNSGNLKIDTTGTGMVNHATITSRGTINNTGTIINNGYIGFYRNYEVKNMGYSGDMFTGTGGFSCSVGILAKDENDSSINTDYTVTIDGSINKNSFEGFLPLSTVIPVKVEAVGYNTYLGSITTYSTLEGD